MPIAQAQRRQLAQILLRLLTRPGSGRGSPLEVTDVTGRECPRGFDFMYGEWMRNEIESGYLPRAACDPDMMILLRQAGEHSVPLYGPAASSLLPPVSDGKIRLAIREFLPHLHSGTDGDKRNVSLRCPDAVHALCGSSDILWRPHGGPEIAARPCGGPGTGGEGLTEDCWTGEKEAAAESMKMEIESAFSRTECVSLSID